MTLGVRLAGASSARRVRVCRLAQSNRLAIDDDDAGVRERHLEAPGRRLERLARLSVRQGERQQRSALEDVHEPGLLIDRNTHDARLPAAGGRMPEAWA